MYAIRFLTSRLIKIFANLFKSLCYIQYFLQPKKRFTIPERAAPLWPSRRDDGITRIVWQTNFTDRFTLPMYVNYLFNRLMAPTYEFRFLVTEARTKAVREEHPKEFFDAYSRLAVGAAQADLWRVLTLHKHGGVYMDIDAHLVWPLHRIVRPGHEELFITVRDEGLSNFFIAARAGSPRLAEIAQRILANIKAPPENNVFKITGPMVFREVLDGKDIETVSARITCHQGNFSNEFFQYVDKKGLKWSDPEAKKIKVVRD